MADITLFPRSGGDHDHDLECEACAGKIGPTQWYHAGYECALCRACAPTYEDMRRDPDTFMDSEGEPLSAEEAERLIALYLGAGGSITDKILNGVPLHA